ncbi:uncharacterized protein LOC134534115 isoform X2 [Bacillus rossius redtenbacheri]|uniref:uncharacterized protein LOC134534115 isoform X2 n=1 Tax=Bacillus rossius redtenbacheri TaxID=93214 RepID=UPI002FDCCA94
MVGCDTVIDIEEIKYNHFTYDYFIQCVKKLGSCCSLKEAYLDTSKSKSSIIVGEVVSVLEKESSDVLKIDIQEATCNDEPGKLFGLFAFKRAVGELLNLKLKKGDFIAIQGAVIEESPCYFIPPEYHKLQARIPDEPHLRTKVFFMRSDSVAVCQSPGKSEVRTMPKYIYQKLSEITAPTVCAHIFGIVVQLKEPARTSNGRLMIRVGLIDDTAHSVTKPFDLYIYYSHGEVAPKIEKHQVLRAHRVKVEAFNGSLDGRVFKSADIVTVGSDVENAGSWCSAAKSFEWTAKDKARVQELYAWMEAQPWHSHPPSNHPVQHMLEDIKGPGLIKVYCKIVAVRKSRDGECLVVTVCDGTVCPTHVKKIHNAESKPAADILSEGSCFERDQLEMDVVVTDLTDDFKLLKAGDYVCVAGLQVKSVSSKSTDDRLLLTLTINASSGSLQTFERQHSIAKRIERKLSSPKVMVEEKLERLETNRNVISLQDITDSLNQLHSSGASPVLDRVISPGEKRNVENVLEDQVECPNKKSKSLTDDDKRGNSETSVRFSSMRKNVENLNTESPPTISSCTTNDDLLDVSNPVIPKDSHIVKTAPVLTFSIGNGDKALQSLKRKIIENSLRKNRMTSPSKNAVQQKPVSKSMSVQEALDCDNQPDEVGCSHTSRKNITSPTKNIGTEHCGLINDALEKELGKIFEDCSEMSVPEGGNDKQRDIRSPEGIGTNLSPPSHNDILPSSGFTSSAGPYSQFISKLTRGVHVTSTQITQSCDRVNNVVQPEDLQENNVEEREERDDISQGKGSQGKSNSKLINHCTEIQHPIGAKCVCLAGTSAVGLQQPEMDNCPQSIPGSQHLYATYDSHPHYCANLFNTGVKTNLAGAVDVGSTPLCQKSNSVQAVVSDCREPDVLQEVQSNIINPENQCHVSEGNIDEHVNIAGTSKSQVHDKTEHCEMTVQEKIVGHSSHKSPKKVPTSTPPQMGNILSEASSHQREPSAGKSPLQPSKAIDQARNFRTSGVHGSPKNVNPIEDSVIPCSQDRHQSVHLQRETTAHGSNSLTSGSSIQCNQEHRRHADCGTKHCESSRPSHTTSCAVQDLESRLCCNSSESFENCRKIGGKVDTSKSRLCTGVQCREDKKADCFTDARCSLCKGISPLVQSVVICGWVVDIEPSRTGDLVCGYCLNCNRIKRLSQLKRVCVKKGGRSLCALPQ